MKNQEKGFEKRIFIMKTRNGFTLVEVLIVVVILVILACIVVPRITGPGDLGVINILDPNYVRIEYSERDEVIKEYGGEILLITKENFERLLPLNIEDFYKLKTNLEKGSDPKLGRWTFESEEYFVGNKELSKSYLRWSGTRKPE